MGASYAVFAIALFVVFAAVIHTIGDTIRLLRTARRTRRRAARSERPASTRRSDRSRIAA